MGFLKSGENPVREGKNGGKLKTGGVHPNAGAPRGQRWSTLIEKAMESKAPKEWHAEAIEWGIAAKGEPVTIRKAMIARAIARYMQGELRVIGTGDNEREVYVNVADPKILGLIQNREEGNPDSVHKITGGEEPIRVVHHIVGFGDDA